MTKDELVERLNNALDSASPGFRLRQEIEWACGYPIGPDFDSLDAAMNRLGVRLRVEERTDIGDA